VTGRGVGLSPTVQIACLIGMSYELFLVVY
jgi:hypothetical protein